MSNSWSIYVIVIVVLNIVGCAWLLAANRTARLDKDAAGKPLGHDFDGIQELNNPLPAWWSWLFVLTIVFGVGYLVLYPGLGNLPGALGWSSTGQYEAEVASAEAIYGPIYAAYFEREITDLVSDQRAVEMGSRLFANNCAACHGSDARGAKGYPNLTDDDWLYGGAPETIVQTITNGRMGAMPPLGTAIGGDDGVRAMVQYVLSLSGREHDPETARQAASYFATVCAACHGPDGKGNQMVGAPNLTDDIWLHGGRPIDIEYQIRTGRINQMPNHRELLSREKIHLLATYVYSLSHGG